MAEFTTIGNACLNQNIYLQNQSMSADHYEWDFCEGDLSLSPAISVAASATMASTVEDIEVVYDGANWFGFCVGRTSHSIVRLDFGNDIHSTPTLVNLGNVGSKLISPTGIKVISENGNWYGFVYNSGGNLITRIDFGNSLNNASPGTQVVLEGTGALDGGIDVVYSHEKWYIMYAGRKSTAPNAYVGILKLSTPTAIPDENNIRKNVVNGVDYISGCKFLQQSGNWYGYLITNNGAMTLQRVNFGADIFNADPFIENISGSVLSGKNPYGVDGGYDAGQYQLFVSTLGGELIRIVLGDDLAQLPVSFNSFTGTGLSNTLKLRIFKKQSTWYGFTVNYSSAEVYRINFPNASCGVNLITSSENYPVIIYDVPGNKTIGLRAFGSHSVYSETSESLTVTGYQAPALAFTSSNNCAQSDVNFVSSVTSEDVINYQWDFGDELVSFSPNPTHTYVTASTYYPSLTVTASNGCTNTAYDTLKIYDPPVPNFTIPSGLACTNNQFTFVNTTPGEYDGNLTYQWLVQDNPVSAARDLQHTFTSTGDQTIKLITSIPGCSNEITKILPAVQAGPVVDFIFSGKCEDEAVTFTNTITEPVVSFAWEFGGQVSSDANPVYTFFAPGEYQTTLTAASPNGCHNSTTKTVTIYSKPSPNFTVDLPPFSCNGSGTRFTNVTPALADSEIASWQWNFNDNSPSITSSLPNPSHVFSNAGTYAVSLTAITKEGCSEEIQKNIVIAQSPVSTFTNSAACKGLPISFNASGTGIQSYYWEIGTSYYFVPNPTHTFNLSGDQPVRLVIQGTNNCETIYTKVLSVPVPLVPDFTVTKNCVGFEAQFQDITSGADPVATQSWDFAGQGSATGQSPTFNFSNAGSKGVKLTVTGQSGCSYSATKNVSVVSAPRADFLPSAISGAIPLVVEFTNISSGASAYLWTFQDGSSAVADDSPVHTFREVGEYAVELTASNAEGCDNKVSKIIRSEIPAPDVDMRVITVSENPDGTWKVIITLENKGNTILENMPVEIDLSGNISLTETVKGPMAPAALYNLVLSYGIVKADNVSFLCARVGLEDDLNPDNNRLCTELENTISFFPAFPNPVTDQLHIEWVAALEQVVSVKLVDSFGREILQTETTSAKGLNQRALDVTKLQTGLYILVLESNSGRKTQRILISNEN